MQRKQSNKHDGRVVDFPAEFMDVEDPPAHPHRLPRWAREVLWKLRRGVRSTTGAVLLKMGLPGPVQPSAIVRPEFGFGMLIKTTRYTTSINVNGYHMEFSRFTGKLIATGYAACCRVDDTHGSGLSLVPPRR